MTSKKWIFFKQLAYFSNHWNLVNKAISGNLVKIFYFSEKWISSCQSLALIDQKTRLCDPVIDVIPNHSQKVKNDSCSTYAKVQYIVSIGQLVKIKSSSHFIWKLFIFNCSINFWYNSYIFHWKETVPLKIISQS